MIREILRKEIEKVVGKADFSVAYDGTHGDYSSNVAMITDKDAEEIAEKIKSPYISKTEIANGFLNFHLSEKGLEEGIKNLNKKFPKQKEKISFDYLDANPTGPVHLGHARSGFYGDVLANILEFYGHKVSREFYVNNAKSSGQIQSLGKTVLGQGEEYKHGQLFSILEKPEVKNKLKTFKDIKEAGFYIAGLIQKENEKFLKNTAKIKFDLFFEEEKMYSSGKVKEIIEKLKKAGATYEKDGAIWLKSSQSGDAEDRVLVRSSGEPTYVLPDIGYHLDRLVKRKYDKAVNIFGADHYGYGPRLKAALEALGVSPTRIEIIIYQMVRLIKGGKETKMSKREGIFVTLEELIKEVGLDAARFFFLIHSVGSHMDFDLDLAKEQSKKNPVYYVQYAHARACSIIRNSGIKFKIFKPQLKIKSPSKHERNLILKLIQFSEIIEDIARDYQAHRLATYVYELAKVFTDFYENAPVLAAETKDLKKSRLALVSIAKNILQKSLSLMGILAPDKM
jgi:arginyl-tRNA synthetase